MRYLDYKTWSDVLMSVNMAVGLRDWPLNTGVLIIPSPDQEGNKLQRQKILIFIYPMYNHNWRNISTTYTCIIRLASKEIFSPSNKIHREVGRAKDLSALL
jgi:hypothetical protein